MKLSSQVEAAVQGTNDSAAKSKCSMENSGYFPQNQGFMKYFVDQPKVKRSALINRGYYLRVKALRSIIQSFIQKEGRKQIVVLGAGFDSTFLSMKDLFTLGECCYIELDFPEVIKNKISLIKKHNLLDASCLLNGDKIISNDYYALGFDLRNAAILKQFLLEHVRDLDFSSPTLIVAECVLTYLPKDEADLIISQVSDIFTGNKGFLLYEQILTMEMSSSLENDAFCSTMSDHFKKLQSPIQSVCHYRSLESLKSRFSSMNWSHVDCMSLSRYWHEIVDDEEKVRINSLEIFDEWEDWDLKISHYFVLLATNSSNFLSLGSKSSINTACLNDRSLMGLWYSLNASVFPLNLCRFGHTAVSIGSLVFIFGGFGMTLNNEKIETKRLSNLVILDTITKELKTVDVEKGPSSRIFHSSFAIGNLMYIIGGRASPTCPLSDFWCFDSEKMVWTKLPDCPVALYRFTATLCENHLVLFGGLGSADYHNIFAYSFDSKMWIKLSLEGSLFTAPFAHSACYSMDSLWIFGGLDGNGNPLNQLLQLEFDFRNMKCKVNSRKAHVNLNCWTNSKILPCKVENQQDMLARYSHQCIVLEDGIIALIGGVSGINSGLKAFGNYQESIACILDLKTFTWFPLQFPADKSYSFINSPLVKVNDKYLSVAGGFTCFSMGTFFDESYLIDLKYEFLQSAAKECNEIKRYFNPSKAEILEIIEQRKPAIISGIDLGSCIDKWTDEYLIQAVGKTLISSHVASSLKKMNFLERNFIFKVMPFEEFIRNLTEDPENSYYLRAIGENPRKQVADFFKSFPSLAGDFALPQDLFPQLKDRLFSSVFRMNSTDFQLWTHYDVMDNILCQIRGVKKLTFWAPRDLPYLYVDGSSSKVTDIDDPPSQFELFSKATPMSCLLGPGEIAFIPSLWFHNVTTLRDNSIAINIFWKHLEDHFYCKKDLYGNRDLTPACNAFSKLDELMKELDKIPEYYRPFYRKKIELLLNKN